MTEEEQRIVDEAKANSTYLKAPNGKASNLNERQWVQVRTKAFKDWFGDWELAYLYNRALTAWNDKNSKGKVVIALSEKAKLRFNELLGKDIKQFILTDDSIRHIKSNHSQREELRGQKNMTPEDVVIIPYLVNNFDSMDLKPEYDDKLGNRAIEITKRINGISVVATIEKGNNKEFLVTNYELIKSDALDATNKTPGLYVRNDSDIAKVQKDIETIKQKANNSSKVVDENGEPIVVYHGSYWNPLEEGEGKAAFSTKYHPNIEQVRNYIVNVIVDGIEYYVRFTIHLQRNNNGFICNVVIHKNLVNNKFYLHEVTQKNLLDEVFLANLAQKPTSSGDLAKVLQNIITTKSEASKVVNENGKPKVVYHQTNRTIYRNVENGKLWDDWDW